MWLSSVFLGSVIYDIGIFFLQDVHCWAGTAFNAESTFRILGHCRMDAAILHRAATQVSLLNGLMKLNRLLQGTGLGLVLPYSPQIFN